MLIPSIFFLGLETQHTRIVHKLAPHRKPPPPPPGMSKQGGLTCPLANGRFLCQLPGASDFFVGFLGIREQKCFSLRNVCIDKRFNGHFRSSGYP